MKIDYLIKYLFKVEEHTGKRSLSLLGWGCIVVLIVFMFGLSMTKKTRVKGNDEKREFISKNEILNVIHAQNEKPIKGEVVIQKSEFLNTDDPEYIPISVIDHTDIELSQAVPYGSIVRCILINRIITNNFSSPVVAQVKEAFYFNDTLLLPKGARIYGEAKSGIEDDRVLVAFHRIVLQSGKEIPINARGLNEDLSGGLQATIITNENKQKVIARIMNFIGGTLLGLQENATNALTGITQIENSSRNALLEGGAKAFDEEAKRVDASIERAQGKGVVTEGTEIFVFFDEKTRIDGFD